MDETKLDILIVDDDPEILTALSTVLRHKGHSPMTTNAEDTACLLELRRGRYHPDIIILDILLSGVDGRDLCRELKSNPQTQDIPIVMFSAYPNMQKPALEAGADAFISKPFAWRDLNFILNQVAVKKSK